VGGGGKKNEFRWFYTPLFFFQIKHGKYCEQSFSMI